MIMGNREVYKFLEPTQKFIGSAVSLKNGAQVQQ